MNIIQYRYGFARSVGTPFDNQTVVNAIIAANNAGAAGWSWGAGINNDCWYYNSAYTPYGYISIESIEVSELYE
jgi:hypothetical protein